MKVIAPFYLPRDKRLIPEDADDDNGGEGEIEKARKCKSFRGESGNVQSWKRRSFLLPPAALYILWKYMKVFYSLAMGNTRKKVCPRVVSSRAKQFPGIFRSGFSTLWNVHARVRHRDK